MEFLNNFFLPPSSDHLHLIKYITLLIYFIHIPFISLLVGGTFFSVFFRIIALIDDNSFYRRVSEDFVDLLVFRKMAGLILGVIPLVVLTFIEGQVFYDATITITKFLTYTTILVAIGITFIYFYQYTFQNPEIKPYIQIFAALLGLLFLFAGYFIFSMSTSLIVDPTYWAFVNDLSGSLFSWNIIARFLHFVTAALAVSGAALVFFFFNWNESKKEVEDSYAQYIRKLGGGIAITFVIFQPIFLFWNLITIPDFAMSEAIYGLSVIVLFLIMMISLNLYRLLKDAEFRVGTNVFVLFVITLIVMIVNDHLARENAIENHTDLLIARATEVESALAAEREAQMETEVEPDLELGQQVYQNQCVSCHRFDQRLVGPPYNEVLPKYTDDKEALIKFVKNPEKIDPNYPAMPNPGLTDKQTRSVVAFLLKKYEEEQ